MKRLALFLSLTLVLCGCAREPAEQTSTPSATAATDITVETTVETTGRYDPDSALEQETAGAILAYPLDSSDCTGIAVMGDDLLVFSGTDVTTLTRLSGSTCYISAEAELDCAVDPADVSVQVSEKGVVYYDEARRELVFLDVSLKEVKRVSMPEDIFGTPLLASDRKTLYYFTHSSLNVLDLDSGLSRLLREMIYPSRTLDGLYFDGSILQCSTLDESGVWDTLFLSTETGETLYETEETVSLWTSGEYYAAFCSDSNYTELITGIQGGEPAVLHYNSLENEAYPLAARKQVAILSGDDAVTVTCWSLETGFATASVTLPAGICPQSVTEGGEYVWFVYRDASSGCSVLCRWDTALTSVDGTESALGPYTTRDNPDTAALSDCAATAKSLSDKYGVDIRIWTDAESVQPDNYTLQSEYRAPLIERCLERLDVFLANFPTDFLRQAVAHTDSGILRICLVGTITGNAGEDVLSTTSVLQFRDSSGELYVAVTLNDALERSLAHGIFHIIDTRVLSSCAAYDDWDELNPESFSYDYSYTGNLARGDTDLLEGDSRCFIDLFSMSFPTEDRARIMEYAMTPDHENYFTSQVMQSKLAVLCSGIREAFGLEDSSEALIWEQYLLPSVG